jgi:hypothetical protein
VIEIYDIDGTLTTSGDIPRQDLIDYIKSDVQDEGVRIFIVSGRAISRLEETEAWLKENEVPYDRIYLNDFSETPGPDVVEAFKAYKYAKIVDEFGLEEIGYVVDDSAEARSNAEGMGITAYTAEQVLANETEEEDAIRAQVDVPAYIQSAAEKGLGYYADGLGGDGLVEQTISDARDLAGGSVSDEKARRMIAWIARHRSDWEGVPQNSDESNENYPGPGAVSALLWGVTPTQSDSADRVVR